jgi:hypothetical protein
MHLIILQRLHALGGQLHERAGGGREVGVAARDERERVDDRRVERDRVELPAEATTECDAARADRVAEPAQGQIERRVDVLHLDHGLDRDARALRALRDLPARRILGAEARVVEDQRRVGEPLDRHRLLDALGVLGEVQQLLVDRRRDVEPAIVDREHDQPALDAPVADRVGDLGRVLAEQADAHARVALAEVLDEVGQQVIGRLPERAEGRRAGLQLTHFPHRVDRLLGGSERPFGLRAEDAPGLGELQPAGAHEQRRAELRLEPADLLRHARLGHVQGLSGRRERAMLGCGEEVLELLECHRFFLLTPKSSKPTALAHNVRS